MPMMIGFGSVSVTTNCIVPPGGALELSTFSETPVDVSAPPDLPAVSKMLADKQRARPRKRSVESRTRR